MSEQMVVVTYAEHCVMAGQAAPEEAELVNGEWVVLDDNGERRHDRDVYAGPPAEIADSARHHNARTGMYHTRLARVLNEALLDAGYESAFLPTMHDLIDTLTAERFTSR